jgi:O-succinylbenzoic acid--CoA ligase
MTLEEFMKEWKAPSDTVLVHTSGSTGKPKPIRVEKARMLNSARITCDFLGLKPGNTALLCMPLDYIAGKMVVVRSIERNLKLVSVKPSGHPLEYIDQHIDFAAMVPMQVYNSLQVPVEQKRLQDIDNLIIGGGAVDKTLEEQLIHYPNKVWSTYGMTETLSHIALRRLNGIDASEWYQPFPSVNISKDDDGCLVIDAPLVHDGILVTHDRVEIKNGRFRILGRLDNVIDSGGIKIQIEEVEKSLKSFLSLPYLITRRSDKKFGEIIVLLTEDKDVIGVETICRKVLPKYWQPKIYKHVDSLPLTGTGKPARAEAEKMAY